MEVEVVDEGGCGGARGGGVPVGARIRVAHCGLLVLSGGTGHVSLPPPHTPSLHTLPSLLLLLPSPFFLSFLPSSFVFFLPSFLSVQFTLLFSFSLFIIIFCHPFCQFSLFIIFFNHPFCQFLSLSYFFHLHLRHFIIT